MTLTQSIAQVWTKRQTLEVLASEEKSLCEEHKGANSIRVSKTVSSPNLARVCIGVAIRKRQTGKGVAVVLMTIALQ
jgi:hypothetical protein